MLENIETSGDGFLFDSGSFKVSENGSLFKPKDFLVKT